MNFWKALDKAADVTNAAVFRFIRENIGAVVNAIELYVFMCFFYVIFKNIPLSIVIAALVVWNLSIFRNAAGIMNNKGFDGLPIPPRKFVKLDGSRLKVEDGDSAEMLLYISELEKYFDSIGAYGEKNLDKRKKKR